MCSIGYLFLGAVTNLFVIGIIRVYLGIFKHPLNLIQSSLSDLTKGQSSNQESQALGYYQSACSLAFIVSPPIAGYLMQTEDGYFKIGLCVFVIYLVNTVLYWERNWVQNAVLLILRDVMAVFAAAAANVSSCTTTAANGIKNSGECMFAFID
ncbi:MFSD9 [Bugula neritina]|uniref:MFSD9 n=1 Tax=Bugula neritina TaxID=10212 RepID=A0A7J7JY45_BUGNE|nr:MFSD9 [Bugula neritina]